MIHGVHRLHGLMKSMTQRTGSSSPSPSPLSSSCMDTEMRSMTAFNTRIKLESQLSMSQSRTISFHHQHQQQQRRRTSSASVLQQRDNHNSDIDPLQRTEEQDGGEKQRNNLVEKAQLKRVGARRNGNPKKSSLPVMGRAKRGIYAGKHIQFGNQISESGKNKSRRTWKPNVHKKTFRSDLLEENIKIKVTTHAVKSIKKAGSFDAFLLSSGEISDSLVAKRLKRKVEFAGRKRPDLVPVIPTRNQTLPRSLQRAISVNSKGDYPHSVDDAESEREGTDTITTSQKSADSTTTSRSTSRASWQQQSALQEPGEDILRIQKHRKVALPRANLWMLKHLDAKE